MLDRWQIVGVELASEANLAALPRKWRKHPSVCGRCKIDVAMRERLVGTQSEVLQLIAKLIELCSLRKALNYVAVNEVALECDWRDQVTVQFTWDGREIVGVEFFPKVAVPYLKPYYDIVNALPKADGWQGKEA